MPQKRHFQVIRTDANGFETTTYVETHTPKDFLKDAEYIAPAMPGKVYSIKGGGCMSAETIRYNKISKATYDAIVEVISNNSIGAVWGEELEKIDAELDAVESRVSAIEDATQDTGRVKQAPVVAPLIPRPGRKSSKGGLFGVVTKQRDTIARLERKLEQKQALIDNARIREQELRIQFGG